LLETLPFLPNGKVDYRSLPEPGEIEPVNIKNFTEPVDEFELYLVKLWESLLNRHPISTTDNFFDLGGDSLLVILMITKLEKDLGQTLSLALLFHAPTIIQLAAVLREKGWNPAWSSLVPIRPYGSKSPLFCVHADGGAFFYNIFTSHLSPDQPLYGLQARGLDGKQEPFTRVEEMAKHYLDEIRSVQPHGPYLISGFSMGGVVIYEMAQQLQAMGETCLIVFLDAPSPSYPEIVGTASRGKIKRLMTLSMKERVKRLLHRLDQRRRWLRDELMSQFQLRLGRPLSPTLRIHRVRELNQKIANEYKPQPYHGEVVILGAYEQPAGARPDPTLGWGKYVSGPIQSYVIDGNHETIFKEPNVKKLAEQLQVCLDEWLEREQIEQAMSMEFARKPEIVH
jgi:thioesterase domain-containing protein/acyl carrier protein